MDADLRAYQTAVEVGAAQVGAGGEQQNLVGRGDGSNRIAPGLQVEARLADGFEGAQGDNQIGLVAGYQHREIGLADDEILLQSQRRRQFRGAWNITVDDRLRLAAEHDEDLTLSPAGDDHLSTA